MIEIRPLTMSMIEDFLKRVDALADQTGQSVSTLSRKLFNDGKGIARLREGGQMTIKTLDAALEKLLGVASQCENPVMLYSVGKDSSVMLHLAEKAFYPSPPPFPLMHVDTRWKFSEMYDFRDRRAKEVGMELLVHINPDGIEQDMNPFTYGSAVHTDVMKTQGLKQALDKYGFDAAFGGARRDEEKSRAKERIFSFRSENHRWDAKNQEHARLPDLKLDRAGYLAIYRTRENPDP